MALTGQRNIGFVYDAAMDRHRCLWDPLHIENPERTTSIMNRLQELQDSTLSQCEFIKGRTATEDELKLIHADQLIDTVKATCRQIPGNNYANYKLFSEKFNVVYINGSTNEIAKLAVGSTLELVDAIHVGKISSGLAVIRPPGHHASSAESNGCCIFNNVAIAAKHLIENRGIQRLLIVDWDVHHGQGTQRSFYEDDRVLYFSIHLYQEGAKWPHLKESNFNFIGSGKGAGYNINLPLNETGLGDAEYLAIFHQLLLPIAYQYNPEMVLVSAGYDAAIGCPEGKMFVTPAMFGHLTQALTSLASGKVAAVLEGGYCLESLAEGVACTLEALLDYPCQPLPSLAAPNPSVVTSILNAISVLRKYWSCLEFQERTVKAVFKNTKQTALPEHFPQIVFNGPTTPLDNNAYLYVPLYGVEKTVELRHEIKRLRERNDLFRKAFGALKHRTCYAYDDLMERHLEELGSEIGPESGARIVAIFKHLTDTGLLSKCLRIKSRDIIPEELALIHSSGYIDILNKDAKEFCKLMTPKIIPEPIPTNVTLSSQTAILRSAGSLLAVVDAVMSGEALNGYAIIRPPGHHAKHNDPAGFCFANNVAIAAKHAIKMHSIQKVLIVDWDVHHGDGSQESFYEDPSVLYISLHRGGEDSYPMGHGKDVCMIGKGNGVGFNVNIPWQQQGATDGDYITAFLQVIMPIAYEFAPELVLVSCGFDAALGDPLGFCKVTRAGYSTMTRMLMSLAGGRLVLALEGGYNLQMLADCSEGVLRALMGFPAEILPEPLVASQTAVQDIKAALDMQTIPNRLWQCLQYRVILHEPTENNDVVPRELTAT